MEKLMPTTELVRFDITLALRVMQDMGDDEATGRLVSMPTNPTTLEEFLRCFSEKSAGDKFLELYLAKL